MNEFFQPPVFEGLALCLVSQSRAGKEMNVLRADGSLMSVKCGLTRRRHKREILW